MMHITQSPQLIDAALAYHIDGDAIIATLDGVTDRFDFSGFPDGEATNITSTLAPCPVLSAHRIDGVLYVTLLRAVPLRPQTDDEAELDEWRSLWTTEQLPSDLMDEPPTGDIPQAVIEWRPQTEIDAEREARAWERVRAERDRRIAAIEWARQRHLDELALGIPTTLTQEQYEQVLLYIQDLRDVPQDNTDPYDIDWPEMPEIPPPK